MKARVVERQSRPAPVVLSRIKSVIDPVADRLVNIFSRDPDRLSLTILKVLTVVAPAFFIWAVESIRHSFFLASLDGMALNVIVALIATAAAFMFSRVIFGEIDSIQKQVVRRNEELTVLNTVASAVNQSLSLDDVLQKAIDKVLQVTSADAAQIFLHDEKTNELVATARAGRSADMLPRKKFSLGEGPVGVAAHTGEPVLVSDLSGYLDQPGHPFRFLACLPLESHNSIVGVFAMALTKDKEFGLDDIRLLANTGAHIAVAIENARLHQQVQAAAAIEERERLAREMHDGVAQVLSYMNVKTQAVKSYLESGQIESTKVQLKELEDTLQDAYSEVRESILGLRLATANAGLVPALKEFIARFHQMTSLRVTLDAEEISLPVLSPVVEAQVIRIVQEALTNVRKHAEARHAWVRLSAQDNLLHVSIVDDGHGFDAAKLRRGRWPQFGLQTMKERAECIQGTLDVASVPARGTRVECRVPITGGG